MTRRSGNKPIARNVIALKRQTNVACVIDGIVAHAAELDQVNDSDLSSALGDIGPRTIARLARICQAWQAVVSGSNTSPDADDDSDDIQPALCGEVLTEQEQIFLELSSGQKRGRRPKHEESVLAALRYGPQTLPKIAKMTGVGYQTVRQTVHRLVSDGRIVETDSKFKNARGPSSAIYALP